LHSRLRAWWAQPLLPLPSGWFSLRHGWLVVGWLTLVVALGLAADWVKAESLGVETDLLAVAGLLGLIPWNLWITGGWWDHRAPLIAATALLYAGMRRRTVPAGSGNYVAPAYTWAATLLLAYVAAVLALAEFIAPAWAVLGVCLFEIGRFSRRGFLRWQGISWSRSRSFAIWRSISAPAVM